MTCSCPSMPSPYAHRRHDRTDSTDTTSRLVVILSSIRSINMISPGRGGLSFDIQRRRVLTRPGRRGVPLKRLSQHHSASDRTMDYNRLTH